MWAKCWSVVVQRRRCIERHCFDRRLKALSTKNGSNAFFYYTSQSWELKQVNPQSFRSFLSNATNRLSWWKRLKFNSASNPRSSSNEGPEENFWVSLNFPESKMFLNLLQCLFCIDSTWKYIFVCMKTFLNLFLKVANEFFSIECVLNRWFSALFVLREKIA